jgi:hypothetical protein
VVTGTGGSEQQIAAGIQHVCMSQVDEASARAYAAWCPLVNASDKGQVQQLLWNCESR